MSTIKIRFSKKDKKQALRILYQDKHIGAKQFYHKCHEYLIQYSQNLKNYNLPINDKKTSLENVLGNSVETFHLKNYLELLIGMLYMKKNAYTDDNLYTLNEIKTIFSTLQPIDNKNFPYSIINSLIQSLPNLPEEFKDLHFLLEKENQKEEEEEEEEEDDDDDDVNDDENTRKENVSPENEIKNKSNNDGFDDQNDSQTKQSNYNQNSREKSSSENSDKTSNQNSESNNSSHEKIQNNTTINNIDNSVTNNSTFNDNSKTINNITFNNIDNSTTDNSTFNDNTKTINNTTTNIIDKNLFLGFVIFFIVILSLIFGKNIITFFQSEQPIFSESDSRYKILILPFREVCDDGNIKQDVGFVISNRLKKLNKRDSLGLNIFYDKEFNFDTDFYNDIDKIRKYNHADHIIYGSLMDANCSSDSNRYCINYVVDNSSSDNYNFQSSNLFKLSSGHLQSDIDFSIYWQAVMATTYKGDIDKSLDLISKMKLLSSEENSRLLKRLELLIGFVKNRLSFSQRKFIENRASFNEFEYTFLYLHFRKNEKELDTQLLNNVNNICSKNITKLNNDDDIIFWKSSYLITKSLLAYNNYCKSGVYTSLQNDFNKELISTPEEHQFKILFHVFNYLFAYNRIKNIHINQLKGKKINKIKRFFFYKMSDEILSDYDKLMSKFPDLALTQVMGCFKLKHIDYNFYIDKTKKKLDNIQKNHPFFDKSYYYGVYVGAVTKNLNYINHNLKLALEKSDRWEFRYFNLIYSRKSPKINNPLKEKYSKMYPHFNTWKDYSIMQIPFYKDLYKYIYAESEQNNIHLVYKESFDIDILYKKQKIPENQPHYRSSSSKSFLEAAYEQQKSIK